jgi:hypothetical protein
MKESGTSCDKVGEDILYTVQAGGIVLTGLIAHRENIRAVNFFMKINATTLNSHV